MPDFIYPTSAELFEIEREKLAVLQQSDPIFQIMPTRDVDAAIVMWEQSDNHQGLQQVRGYNNKSARVKNLGSKRFLMEPGVYGEHAVIDELELTMKRSAGTFAQPIDISDLVMARQDFLLERRINRLRNTGWDLVVNGLFTVSGPNGVVVHTDQYAVQTYSRLVAWTSAATAKPLADFRAVKLLARGKSVSFGTDARCYMNQTTFNLMIANTNDGDLAGKRTSGLGSVLGLSDVNAVLLQEGLPTIEIYEEGYEDEDDTWQMFIPDGKAVVVGRRSNGGRIAEYQMTRNASNPNMEPGAYTKVKIQEDPTLIEVHDGHNGGPAMFHPSAIVVMDVD